MTLENINVGNLANDGTGDDLRDAFIKVNQNFQSLEYLVNLRGSNLGSVGAEVFATFENGQLNFRRIIGSETVTVEQLDNTIKINTNIPPRTLIFGTESGSVVIESGLLNLQGDENILVTGNQNTSTLNFAFRGEILKYLGFDFGSGFGLDKTSILDYIISTVDVNMGTFTNPDVNRIDLGAI